MRKHWGHVDSNNVWLFTLEGEEGLRVSITNFGSTIVRLLAPDNEGRHADVVLGFDSLDGYEESTRYVGGVVGRTANRIAGARCVIQGRVHRLTPNEPPNHIHGGANGFDKRVWDVLDYVEASSLTLGLVSRDGEEGYPGTVNLSAHYEIVDGRTLRTNLSASTDAPTLCDPVQHIYWNLAGHASGSVLGHELALAADHVLRTDKAGIPIGLLDPVDGTPFDFRELRTLGSVVPTPAPDQSPGFDNHFALRSSEANASVAELRDPLSGRLLRIRTDLPGLQLYTGNVLAPLPLGKEGIRYAPHAGVCLEPHHWPNAINTPGWKAPLLLPDRPMNTCVEYELSYAN